jgi:hypothetical protein
MNGSDYIEMEENKEPEMELKRCPFCGEAEIRKTFGETKNHYCVNCDSESEVWNTRPIEDELQDTIAALNNENISLNARIKELEELLRDNEHSEIWKE